MNSSNILVEEYKEKPNKIKKVILKQEKHKK
jgi:hypothetical protein